MRSSYISVNALKTDEDRQKISGSAAKVAAQMTELGTSIARLENSWSGQANEAFLRSLAEDFELMGQLLTEISQFSEALLAAEQEYLQTEYEVSSRIDTLGV